MKTISKQKVAELLRPIAGFIDDMKEISESEYGDKVQKQAEEVVNQLNVYGNIPESKLKKAQEDLVYDKLASLRLMKKLAKANSELRSEQATNFGEPKEASGKTKKKSELIYEKLTSGRI